MNIINVYVIYKIYATRQLESILVKHVTNYINETLILRCSTLKLLFLKFLSLIIILTTSCVSDNTSNFSIFKEGRTECKIVISSEAKPAALLAAREFQFFIKEMSGVSIPIVNDSEKIAGNKILIGESNYTKELGINVENYRHMQTLIKFLPDTLVLIGRDDKKEDCRSFSQLRIDSALIIDYAKANGKSGSEKIFIPGIFDYQGSLRATYRFLEEWCDVGFFGASPINLHVPKKGTLVVTGSTHHHESAIQTKIGALGVYGRSSGNSEYGPRPSADQVSLYSRRIRWGGVPWYVNHTFEHFKYKERFIKPEVPQNINHPSIKNQLKKLSKNLESFEKEVDGLVPTGRSHQFCYKTDELIQQIAKDARDFFDGNVSKSVDHTVKNLQGRSNTFFLVPFDVGGYCQCVKCLPILEIGKGRANTDFNTGEASDYVFSFVNAVAEEVAKTHPDKFIGTLAYEGYYWAPTSFDMKSNVSMSPCVHTKFWDHSPFTVLQNELKHYKDWVKRSSNGKMGPMGMWHYDFDVSGAPTVYYSESRAKMINMFIYDGIKHIFHCGAPPMLEMHVSNKLYENPNQDVDSIINDFFNKYFGPASKPMKELQRLLEDYTSNPKYRPLHLQGAYIHDWLTIHSHVLTDKQISKLKILIKKAIKSAPMEPYKSRIEHWNTTMVQHYENSLVKRSEDLAKKENKSLSSTKDYFPGFIADVKALPAWHWYANKPPSSIVDGASMKENSLKGSKSAKLNFALGAFHWKQVIPKNGAWVMFDLGAKYNLDEMHIWNYNDKNGNKQFGLKNIEIAYTEDLETLYDQSWKTLARVTVPISGQENKADLTVEFGGKPVRYVYIRTLGGEGQGNWSKGASHDSHQEYSKYIDSATGMGSAAFKNRKFTIGLGQVRFYGKPLQLPRPKVGKKDGKIRVYVKGYPDAKIRYTIDNSIPKKILSCTLVNYL